MTLKALSQSLLGGKHPTSFRSYLVSGTVGTFALTILSTGFGFVNNLLLARFLGATDYGVYTYIFAWIGLLSILAVFGMQQVLIREIAAYHEREAWGLIHGILRWTGGRAPLISAGIILITGVGAWLGRDYLDPGIFPAFWASLALLPLLALLNLSAAAMQGMKQVVLAKIPSVIIQQPLFALLIVIVYLLSPQTLNALWTVALTGAATVVALVTNLWLQYKNLPHEVFISKPVYQSRAWLASALPLLLFASLFEMNTRAPTLVLGSVAGVRSAGVFNVASLIAGSVSFVLVSVNTAIGPLVSSLYASGEMRRLQRIVTLSARMMFGVAAAISLALILLRHWLLQFFGSEFQQAGPVLIILVLGQMMNVAAGSAGTLLVMTGHERDVVVALGVSTAVLLILSVLLIPVWGIVGASLASAASTIIWNLILVPMLSIRVGIDSTALGWISRWKA